MSNSGWTAKRRDLIVPPDAGSSDPRVVISDEDPTDPAAFGDILVTFYFGESKAFVIGVKEEVDGRGHLRIYGRKGVSGVYTDTPQMVDLVFDPADPSGANDYTEILGATRAGVGGQTTMRLQQSLAEFFGTRFDFDHPITDTIVALAGDLRRKEGFDEYSQFFWTDVSLSTIWTAGGAATTLGNGAIFGRYIKQGKLVHVELRLTWGTTTSAPAGPWSFELPFQPFNDDMPMIASAYDNSAGLRFPCVAQLTTVQPYLDRIGSPSGTVVGNTVPFAWASGDRLAIVGSYRTP